jgi:hypothetical protein
MLVSVLLSGFFGLRLKITAIRKWLESKSGQKCSIENNTTPAEFKLPSRESHKN